MGDINAAPGLVIECKNEKKFTLASYMDELDQEMFNAEALTGAVWLKRPGTTAVGKAYAIMPVDVHMRLLRMFFAARAAGITDPL